jgi:hypothetical protein
MTENGPIMPDGPNDRPGRDPAAAPIIDHEPAALAPPSPKRSEPEVVKRGGTPFIVTLLFCGLLAGGIYYTWTHPAPGGFDPASLQSAIASQQDQLKSDLQSQLQSSVQASKDAVAQAVGPLHDQMAALAARVEKLEKASPAAGETPAPSAAGASPDDLNALSQRVAQLAAKIDSLQQPQAEAAPTAAPDHAVQDATGGQIAALSAKIDQLEQSQKADLTQTTDQQKAALDAATQAASSAQAQVAALTAKLDAVEQAQKADTTKADLTQTAEQQKAALDALTARLAKIEQGTGHIETVADAAARAARIDELEAALAAGQPLGTIPNAPPALARFAKTAPPTDAALRQAFPAVAARAEAVSQPQDAHENFWSRVLARAQQLVVVRRGDDVIVGDPAAGIIARATDAVNRDDLPGAVHALGALQGPAADAVAGWVQQVRSLLDARAALTAMATGH